MNDEDLRRAIAQILMNSEVSASNAGPVQNGLPGNRMFGEAGAPAYSGSMPIPGTNFSVLGQYQSYPGMRPNMGVGLRYGFDF